MSIVKVLILFAIVLTALRLILLGLSAFIVSDQKMSTTKKAVGWSIAVLLSLFFTSIIYFGEAS